MTHGVDGAHASIPFQCEGCWMVNLEGFRPVPGLHDTYIQYIRRANLDSMVGGSKLTMAAHSGAVKRTVRNCELISKTPSIPPRGPMPMQDVVGMGLLVEMLHHGSTATPRIKGQKFIQYDSMRKDRSTYTMAWQSSPEGILEGSSFAKGVHKVTFTRCPTQSELFGRASRGAERRMGFVSEANKPLHIKAVTKVLGMIKQEVLTQPPYIAREMLKVGAAIATAQSGSLRGPEVLMLDLAGIRTHISKGRNGIMPEKPMDVGTDLFNAPHVYIALLGEFKGENGVREHLVAVASESKSGVDTRWWLEKLIQVREAEGCISGPAFGHADGTVATMSDYDDILHMFLKRIQEDSNCSLIEEDDDVAKWYGFFRTFRKTAEGRARAANLDGDIQNAMNRWKKVERAQGSRPKFSMIDHYSNVRDLMPVTWRYSYVQ